MLLLGVAPAYALETPTESEELKAEENLFPFPTGTRATLSCEELHRAVATFDAHLAFDPPSADPAKIAAATADWLDPYGLWAPVDGRVERALDADRKALLRELSGKVGDCHTSERLGAILDAANTAAKRTIVRPWVRARWIMEVLLVYFWRPR